VLEDEADCESTVDRCGEVLEYRIVDAIFDDVGRSYASFNVAQQIVGGSHYGRGKSVKLSCQGLQVSC
jgi:hypothetical protein